METKLEKLQSDYKKKFIGIDKIKSLKLIERKTCLGKDVYELTYTDGSKVELPKHVIEILTTEKSTDATALRELIIKPIVKDVLSVLLDYEIRLEDINFVLENTSAAITESVKQAVTKLFGKGFEDRTLEDIDEILKKDV